MDAQITNAALRAIRRVLRAADQGGRRLATATGLTPSQLLVLQEIRRRGQTTPGTIAAALQFGQATVTNIVDKLVSMSLVERQRSDRDKRQILLRTSTVGDTVLDNAPDLLQTRFKDRFGTLPAWEQAMILAALEKLGEILDAGDMNPAPLIDGGAIDRSLEDAKQFPDDDPIDSGMRRR